MGFLFNSHGRITIEKRRESFYIHSSDKINAQKESPEFYLSDLDDMIDALVEIQLRMEKT
jgi:hypothetical protein